MKKDVIALIVLLTALGCSKQPSTEQPGTISLESYGKIHEGMAFEEVKSILGKPTRTVTEIAAGGISAGT